MVSFYQNEEKAIVHCMTEHIDTTRSYLTTPQAAQRSGFTRSYLTYLLRNNKIEGFRYPETREWFIYTDSLDDFLATTRKPGPKGPRTQPGSG